MKLSVQVKELNSVFASCAFCQTSVIYILCHLAKKHKQMINFNDGAALARLGKWQICHLLSIGLCCRALHLDLVNSLYVACVNFCLSLTLRECVWERATEGALSQVTMHKAQKAMKLYLCLTFFFFFFLPLTQSQTTKFTSHWLKIARLEI